MKKFVVFTIPLLLAGWLFSAPARAESDLKTLDQRFSYALGLQVGVDIQRMPGHVDAKAVLMGIQDQLKGRKPRLTPTEINLAKADFQKKVQKEKTRIRGVLDQKNRKAGRAFLAKNKKKKGVKVTASGLQYQVLKRGNGPRPSKTSVVEVNYRGTLLDGTEFDSSYKRGKPVSFPLSRVIPGWTEGLQLMPVGSKYRFFIPSSLAYGKRGAPPKIEPGRSLIFDVELLRIIKK